MSHKENLINILSDHVNDLFKVTFPNDKEIIQDKRSDVVMEILNMLFRDVSDVSELNNEVLTIFDIVFEEKYYYKPSKSSNVKKLNINATKKQVHTLKLFESMIYMIVDRLNDIVNENDVPLLNSIKTRLTLEQNINNRFHAVIQYLESASSYDDIIWNQSLFDSIKLQIADEIKRSLYKPTGTKGIGVCRQCGSDDLQIITKQTRSCDEGQASEYNCLECKFKWVVK
jgi:DNA-directed RNA polymerase subunit M/transcription elongation factor TFIIS